MTASRRHTLTYVAVVVDVGVDVGVGVDVDERKEIGRFDKQTQEGIEEWPMSL